MNHKVVRIDPENTNHVEILRRAISAQPMTQNVSFEAVQGALRSYPEKYEVDVKSEEVTLFNFEQTLKCAWEGTTLPIPCTKCNGLFRHYPYCPFEMKP